MNRNAKNQIAVNEAINKLLKKYAPQNCVLLDVGCWNGASTLTYKLSLNSKKVYGVEFMDDPASIASSKGIEVIKADLEREAWNIPEASIDVVVCNQVFEHLKNIFFAYDQITRVLKPNGICIISVPNLASFHNRILLAAGQQPTSIRIWGPHIRGFTLPEFSSFLLTKKMFKILKISGIGFYPLLPKSGGNLIAGIWRNASHTPIWVLQRLPVPQFSFQNYYLEKGQQTVL